MLVFVPACAVGDGVSCGPGFGVVGGEKKTQKKMFLERVAERVSSLSKLKSVLVTDSHVQLLQRPCSATYGYEQRRRRLPSSSGDALPEG